MAIISDSHQISNVNGIDDINFMINNPKKLNLFFLELLLFVSYRSSEFETSGYVLDDKDVEKLMEVNDVYYLSEVMDFKDVINKDIRIINENLTLKYISNRH
ncbi:hypothetical protein QIA31_05170 (plasmid) [Borreliella turdi]|uniref:hypothetical protein n=1 Tax=Borreliella turdi TaxID=57863 RepID=UPI003AEF6A43